MNEDFYSASKDTDDIDLGKIFRYLLMQSKLIISIVVVVTFLAYLNYSFSTKQYLVKSLLQYESFNQNILNPSSSIQMASPSRGSDITNLIELYESRTNLLRVIEDLKLNIDLRDLNDDESIDINITSDKADYDKKYNLKFSFSESGYTLLDDDLNELQTSDYGKEMLSNGIRILIKSANLKEYRPIEIRFRYPESMYNSLKLKLDVDSNISRNSFFKNEGLITVSLQSDDIDLAKEIINYANKIFLEQRMFLETEKSRKAINFIDKNMDSIGKSVENNKIQLKEFLERNKSIDVDLEIEAIIQKIQSMDRSLSDIDIEIARAEEIYTKNNPIYLNLLNKKTFIETQIDQVLSEIEMMPKEQQEYIDLYNELEISRAIFEELESRRLGFSILEASTIGDIRVVDAAYVVSLVSPRAIFVVFMALIAFIVACFIAAVRGFNFLPLSNPAEIFDNNIRVPIVGVIPEVADMDSAEDDLALTSSIESLIVNISSVQDNQPNNNLITITSPTPFNGKSSISMKLAEGYSKIGKKVLLVDNDLKRGKIARKYNTKSISEKTFNSIDESSINKYKLNENFYLIPRVKGLNNSFQFLYSHSYKDKISFFKDYFDYVIFDTGPILSVADTSILVEQSNVNILIARHGISRINEVRQAIDNFKQINTSIDGIIYNAYAKPKSYYGYYGLYGNYAYQYYAEKYLDDVYSYEKKD